MKSRLAIYALLALVSLFAGFAFDQYRNAQRWERFYNNARADWEKELHARNNLETRVTSPEFAKRMGECWRLAEYAISPMYVIACANNVTSAKFDAERHGYVETFLNSPNAKKLKLPKNPRAYRCSFAGPGGRRIRTICPEDRDKWIGRP